MGFTSPTLSFGAGLGRGRDVESGSKDDGPDSVRAKLVDGPPRSWRD
jgi:hypothetical protein